MAQLNCSQHIQLWIQIRPTFLSLAFSFVLFAQCSCRCLLRHRRCSPGHPWWSWWLGVRWRRGKGPNFRGFPHIMTHFWPIFGCRHFLVLFTLCATVTESPIAWNNQNGIGASSRGTAWDRLNLGSNESWYKILNPHITHGRVNEREWVQKFS